MTSASCIKVGGGNYFWPLIDASDDSKKKKKPGLNKIFKNPSSVVCSMSYNSMTPNSCILASLPTIATGVHASASVALLFFLFEQWECDIYWWILVTCRLVYILYT